MAKTKKQVVIKKARTFEQPLEHIYATNNRYVGRDFVTRYDIKRPERCMITGDIFSFTLSANQYLNPTFIAAFQRFIRMRMKKLGFTTYQVELSGGELDYGYYDEVSVKAGEFKIVGFRWQTDEEYTETIAQYERYLVARAKLITQEKAEKKRLALKKEADDKALYERLKKKFGDI